MIWGYMRRMGCSSEKRSCHSRAEVMARKVQSRDLGVGGEGVTIQGSGFRVQEGSGFKVQGSGGFRVQGSGFRVLVDGRVIQGDDRLPKTQTLVVVPARK